MRNVYTQFLPNFKYLESTDLPTTSNFYGWHLNGTSAFSGSAWLGGIDLTTTGTNTTRINHLSDLTYCRFGGASGIVYANTTSFNTNNESFTVGAWIKFDDVAGTYYPIAKSATNLGGAGADTSFLFIHSLSTATLIFAVSYSSGNTVQIQIPNTLVADLQWHHIVCMYDQTNTVMSLFIDGKIVGSVYNTNLATRINTANSKLQFGGYGNGTANGLLNGGISDMFYYKGVLSFDQIRQIFVSGSKSLSFINMIGNVNIWGELDNGRSGNYYINPTITPGAGTWTTTRAVFLPYRTTEGSWRLRFNVTGSVAVAVGALTLTFSGITFKNIAIYYQVVNIVPYNSAYTGSAYTNPGTGQIVGNLQASNTQTIWIFSGDVELDSKPLHII